MITRLYPETTTELGAELLNRLLAEAVAVAEDTRAFLVAPRCRRADGRDGDLDLLVEACALGRVTTRIAYCVAWVMSRKAVLAGEIGADHGRATTCRLDGHAVCLPPEGEPEPADPAVRELLRRSAALYRRIDRLDALLDG